MIQGRDAPAGPKSRRKCPPWRAPEADGMELVTGKPPVGLAPGRCAHRPAALLMQYGCCNSAVLAYQWRSLARRWAVR
jgi:hypothetical protein